MAQGKLDLLLQTLGIGQEVVLGVLGMLTTLLLVAIALLRRWRRSVRIRNAVSRPS